MAGVGCEGTRGLADVEVELVEGAMGSVGGTLDGMPAVERWKVSGYRRVERARRCAAMDRWVSFVTWGRN